MLNWFDRAEEFRKRYGNQLTRPGFEVLEHIEPEERVLPEKVQVEALEIPGIYRVASSYRGESGFRFFMDGVQRTVLWQYFSCDGAQVPLYLHLSGACIIERERPDRFVPVEVGYRSEILVPRFIHRDAAGLDGIVDTGAEKPWDLGEIRGRAKVASRALRQELELEVLHRFLVNRDPDEAPLIKDGNLIGVPRGMPVVGIIKTHNTLYLQEKYPEVQRMVWSMPHYHRSNVFTIRQLESRGWSRRSDSFYLRLHSPTEPETGLIRVEYGSLPVSVDELASWLIAERYVISGCSRWDRQLYPVQVCEDYLRTQLPSPRIIAAALRSMEAAT
jgi:hypothetical protein